MADETRHSQALEAEIITDPMDKARKESYNVVDIDLFIAGLEFTFTDCFSLI